MVDVGFLRAVGDGDEEEIQASGAWRQLRARRFLAGL